MSTTTTSTSRKQSSIPKPGKAQLDTPNQQIRCDSCKGDTPNAVDVICRDCVKYLCQKCHTITHRQTTGSVSHKIFNAKPIHFTGLCQWCESRKNATLFCENCKKSFCDNCHKANHSGAKSKHSIRPLQYPSDFKRTSDDQGVKTPSNIITEEATGGSNDDDQLSEGFLLFDNAEILQVKTGKEFLRKLNIEDAIPPDVKVVSMFGNTGDGKSHTLNHTFFNGKQVFKTSSSQASCTIGVWVAYDSSRRAIIIDTEGLLGVSETEHRRTRMLMKVLAISDVVIYRTRADRLHSDMYKFIGDASDAYRRHFKNELRQLSHKANLQLTDIGPALVVFHETIHTHILGQGDDNKPSFKSADTILKEKFAELKYSMDAFSSIRYVGTRTKETPTDFTSLIELVTRLLEEGSVRSPRHPNIVFTALKHVNNKFSGRVDKSVTTMFPDEYFTCSVICLSCGFKCSQPMNHCQEQVPHDAVRKCLYQSQYENKVFMCKSCFETGNESVVIPKMSSAKDAGWLGIAKYAWAGYVLECSRCGIIYRSRQHWYGNKEPAQESVHCEIRHVWPDGTVFQGSPNAGRQIIDGLSVLGTTVSTITAKPTRIMSDWFTDQLRPAYWVPNSQLNNCNICGDVFTDNDSKHHCRNCGEGFCDECSSKTMPVPERGWGPEPVRVCDTCYKDCQSDSSLSTIFHDDPVTARKIIETVRSTCELATPVISYAKDYMVEAARPTYWVSDSEFTDCFSCKEPFTDKVRRHHCRSCGQVYCDRCSSRQRPVPSRGYDHPVRVCDTCYSSPDQF